MRHEDKEQADDLRADIRMKGERVRRLMPPLIGMVGFAPHIRDVSQQIANTVLTDWHADTRPDRPIGTRGHFQQRFMHRKAAQQSEPTSVDDIATNFQKHQFNEDR